ncbi:MAG: hypothetical protein ACXW6A_05935 [Gemmatirosa sp.]
MASHGAVMTVRPSNAHLFDGLRALLPPGAVIVDPRPADAAYEWTHAQRAGEPDLHRVTVLDPLDPAENPIVATHDARHAAALLASDLEFRVALHARDRLFVHAAAVAWQGRAILVPGRSFSGKSTLAAALLRAGATYLSDEWAVLGDDGRVAAYPRALQLRDGEGIPLPAVSAQRLGARVATERVPVGLVVRTTYRPNAAWQPGRMRSGQMALALLDNAPAARRASAYALRVIACALGGAVGLHGERGDADATAHALLRTLTELATPS